MQKQDCRPNKALRTTTKAFLKRKLIERDAAAKKKAKASLELQTPVTPVVAEAVKGLEDGPVGARDVGGHNGGDQHQKSTLIGESQNLRDQTAVIEEPIKSVSQPSAEVG